LPVGTASASAFSSSIFMISGFSLSRIAVMSEMVRGGATKPAGSAVPVATFGAA